MLGADEDGEEFGGRTDVVLLERQPLSGTQDAWLDRTISYYAGKVDTSSCLFRHHKRGCTIP